VEVVNEAASEILSILLGGNGEGGRCCWHRVLLSLPLFFRRAQPNGLLFPQSVCTFVASAAPGLCLTV